MFVVAPQLFLFYQLILWHQATFQYQEKQLLYAESLELGCIDTNPLLCSSWVWGQGYSHKQWWRLLPLAGEGKLFFSHTANILCFPLMQISASACHKRLTAAGRRPACSFWFGHSSPEPIEQEEEFPFVYCGIFPSDIVSNSFYNNSTLWINSVLTDFVCFMGLLPDT